MKVQWKHCRDSEVTQETKSDMHAKYPQFFRLEILYYMFEDVVNNVMSQLVIFRILYKITIYPF